MKLFICGLTLLKYVINAAEQEVPTDAFNDTIPLIAREALTARRGSAGCTERAKELELYILQDGTSSFRNYLSEARTLLPRLVQEISKEFPVWSVGLGMFGDKPLDWDSTDECFKPLIERTSDFDEFQRAASKLKTLCNGGDGPEDSLEVMAYVSGSAGHFTPPAEEPEGLVKILIVVTDNESHYVDDKSSGGWGDWFGNSNPAEGLPENPNLATQLLCANSNYPKLSQVTSILKNNNIHPLVLSTKGAIDYWDELIHKEMGFDDMSALITPFSMNADGLVETMLASLLQLECQVVETSTTTKAPSTTTTEKTEESTTEEEEKAETTSEKESTTKSEAKTTEEKTTEKEEEKTTKENQTSEAKTTTTKKTEKTKPSTEAKTTTTTSTGGGGASVPVVLGAASGGIALAAAAGFAGYSQFTGGSNPANVDVEMQETGEPEMQMERDIDNPTTSADYGDFGV